MNTKPTSTSTSTEWESAIRDAMRRTPGTPEAALAWAKAEAIRDALT